MGILMYIVPFFDQFPINILISTPRISETFAIRPLICLAHIERQMEDIPLCTDQPPSLMVSHLGWRARSHMPPSR